MPNTKGNYKQVYQRRAAEETEDGRRIFIEDELELLSLKLKQLGERFDHPPELLESINEGVERIRKLNQEIEKT